MWLHPVRKASATKYAVLLVVLISSTGLVGQQVVSRVDAETKRALQDKPIGFLLGLLPNSDGFIDNEFGLTLNYGSFQSGFSFASVSRGRVVEHGKNTKSSVYEEKVYNLRLLFLQPWAIRSGSFSLPIGIGVKYSDAQDAITDVRRDNSQRIFVSEQRQSQFLQPYAAVSLLYTLNFVSFEIGNVTVPYQLQRSTNDVELSTVDGTTTHSETNEGLEVLLFLNAVISTRNSIFVLEASWHRRLSIETMEIGKGSSTEFETATSQTTVTSYYFGYGPKSLRKYLDGIYPIVTFGYEVALGKILAENQSNDQMSEKEQWKLGFVLKVGAL